MNKKLIRLTENDLHRIIKESVNRIVKESINDLADNPQYERFLESLYGLVTQYYDKLGLEIIVRDLKGIAQWVDEGALDK